MGQPSCQGSEVRQSVGCLGFGLHKLGALQKPQDIEERHNQDSHDDCRSNQESLQQAGSKTRKTVFGQATVNAEMDDQLRLVIEEDRLDEIQVSQAWVPNEVTSTRGGREFFGKSRPSKTGFVPAPSHGGWPCKDLTLQILNHHVENLLLLC